MDKLREMEIFVAIVDRGSFTGAAEKVGMSPAAVSRAVNSLETRLGTHLLARTTRSVRPTDAGMAYLEACRKVLDTITDAEANIAADPLNPVGTLTVSAPVLFGQRYVAPLVNAFALRYPDVTVNAVYVDRTARLLEEGVDIALRIGHLGDSSTYAIPFGFVRRRTYAAPSYLAEHGEPVDPRNWPITTACPSLASRRRSSGCSTKTVRGCRSTSAADGGRPGSRGRTRGRRRRGDHPVVVVSSGAGGTRWQAPACPDVIRAREDPGEPLHVERRSSSGKIRGIRCLRHYARTRTFRAWTPLPCELPGRWLPAHRDRTRGF